MTAECTAPSESAKLQSLLQELCSESREQVAQRVASHYDRLAAPFEDRLVLCGAGQLGRLALPGVRAAGVEPLAFCDNNAALWGTQIDGLPILSPAAAAKLFNGKAAFLTVVYNPGAITRQLRKLGCAQIVPYPAFFWKHWRSLPGEIWLELPQRILDRAVEIPPAYELLADEKSREEFRTQLRWRCLLDYACLPVPDPPREMYFPADLVRLSANEIFADCGAFDGDSIRAFIEKAKGRFHRIYAFEPDAVNRRALAGYIASLPEHLAARIETLPYALGRDDGKVQFSAEGSVSSQIGDAARPVEIECRSLDSVLREREAPTFIKMDIEGAEVDAIPGAATMARLARPAMAVCAYHRCEHLWRIPALLKSANPDYKIFLRRYAEECWETVYYAIPPERLSPKARVAK